MASAKKGDHIMCIYKDEETEFQDALDFLKEGLDKNELIIFITSRFSNIEVLEIMEKRWKVDVRKLFTNLEIIIKDPTEIYLPNGHLDSIKVEEFFQNATRYAIEKGKTGLRAFGSTHKFFEKHMDTELIGYESRYEKQFEIPFTAICPYQKKDVEKLSKEQFDTLKEHHLFIRGI